MHGKRKTIGVFRPKIRISIHYFQPVIGHSNVHEKDYKSHSKTTNLTCPTGSCNFVIIEKFTRAYYHQIAREIINIQQTEKSVLFFFNKPAYTLEKQTVPPWRKLSLAGVSSFLVSDLLPMLQNIRLPHPHPTPYFLLSLTPLVQISFSSQPFAAIKIKDGGHDFR